MPILPQTADTPAQTDQEVFLECAARLKIAEEVEGTNRVKGIEDLEFADGQQWPDDLYNQRRQTQRPTLTINHTNALVKRVVNNMRQQRPRIKVHPTGNGAKVEDARIAQGLIRHIETQSKASVAYDTGGESAVRIGWGYWRILGDYIDETSFDQELKIAPVRNTFTGYIDPSAQLPDGSDMEWFIFSTKMKRAQFKREYPDAPLNDWSVGGAGDLRTEWENREEIRLAEYYRIKHTPDTLYKLSDGRAIFKSQYTKLKDQFQAAGLQLATDLTGKIISRPTSRRQIQWFRITGSQVVDKRDLPGHWIPVIRVEGNTLDLNGEVRRKGMIRDLKDPARMFNYWRTASTEKLALSSKAPWIGAEGQFDGHPEWDDANQKPYSRLTYKVLMGMDGNPLNIPPPQRLPAIEVEAGFAEAAQSAAGDLAAVASMPHEPSQDTPGSVVSGVALRRRQAISDISHLQYYENQTAAIAHTGVILLDLIPHYYSEERMQRIIGDDGVPQMVNINQPQQQQGPDGQAISTIKNDMTVGRYDVVMDTGPGYETRRQEGAEAMIDLLGTPLAEPIAKTGADLVVRNMDFAGADELADRLMPLNPQGMEKAMEALPKQAQSIVMSLQQELKAAQETIQKQALEIKYKMQVEQGWMQTEEKKAHLAATVKAHDTETRAHSAEAVAHINAQAGIAKTEISAAGQLLNTNTEAAHDRAAARAMVDTAQAVEKGE